MPERLIKRVVGRRRWISAFLVLALLLPAFTAEAKRRRRRRKKPPPREQPAEPEVDEGELELAPLEPIEPAASTESTESADSGSVESSTDGTPILEEDAALPATTGLELAPIEQAPTDLRSPWSNPLVWVLGGIGVASVGAGALFGLRSRSQFADAEATNVQRKRSELNESGKLSAILANSLLGAGAALIGGASTLVVLRIYETSDSDLGAPSDGGARGWGIRLCLPL